MQVLRFSGWLDLEGILNTEEAARCCLCCDACRCPPPELSGYSMGATCVWRGAAANAMATRDRRRMRHTAAVVRTGKETVNSWP